MCMSRCHPIPEEGIHVEDTLKALHDRGYIEDSVELQ